MGANFEIVGTLKAVKDSDNFKGWEVTDFDSGWQNTRYRFNVISGMNRFMCEISGGKWSEESGKTNTIMTFSRAEAGKKSEKMNVNWNDRRNPDVINKVAGFRVYTCNLLTFDERDALKEEGKEEEVAKKSHSFIERTEYAALVKKVIDSGKYADAKFKISGTIDYQYSTKNNQYYRTYTVNKIYKVSDDTECKAEMTIGAFYTENSLDTEMFDDTKKYLFNCYTDHYFSAVKGNRFVPITLVIKGDGDEKAAKRAEGFKKKLTTFDDEATVRKINLVCDMIDGAETSAITFDDLDDDTKENVELGLIDLLEAIAGLGGNMVGNKISEYRIKAFAKTSAKGSEVTVYTEDDLKKLPIADEAPFDLFDDSDDDI